MNIRLLFVEKTDNFALQLFRYLFVGGFAAVINVGSLVLLKELAYLNYLFANIFAFSAGLAVNFALSKIFIFTKKIPLHRAAEFLFHGAISGISLVLDTFLLWFFTSVIGMYYVAAKIISTGIGFIWNFTGRKALYIQFDKTQFNSQKTEANYE